MRKVVFANQKGGVGKSIVAYHFAYYLADHQKRVLFVDADEQGNSSKTLCKCAAPGVDAAALFAFEHLTLPTLAQEIVVLQGGPNMRQVEKATDDLQLLTNLEARLAELSSGFDYCVLDTPGSNSKAANAVLLASNFVVIPCIIDGYSLDVATTMLQRIIGIQQRFNPGLVNLGILPTLFDATAPTQKADLMNLLHSYQQYVLGVKISKRSSLREAAVAGVPVWQLQKSSAREAGKEIRAAFDVIAEGMGGL